MQLFGITYAFQKDNNLIASILKIVKLSMDGETLKTVPAIVEQIKKLMAIYIFSTFINLLIITTKQIPLQ